MRVNLRPTARGGFTLVELLVVLSIIAVLVALTMAGVAKFGETGPRTATRSNLSKILTAINGQWKAVRDKAGAPSEPMTSTVGNNNLFLAQAQTNVGGGPTAADPRVKKEY